MGSHVALHYYWYVTACDSTEITGHQVNMKYYWEVRWIIILGFAKRERFVDGGVKLEFLS
jgi:hypothetical protein